MSITTKTGDKGITCLYKGKKVYKDHLRIELCGSLDELGSYLGLSKNLVKSKKIKKIIEAVQRDLYLVAAEVVTQTKFLKKLKRRLDETFPARIERSIKDLEKKLPRLNCFCLCGENLCSSVLDVARAVSRRAERKATTLKRKSLLKNSHILVYLNRLSDLLFLLARFSAGKTKR
ncbi:MAG: cob(I)yrinic acid a,c-diamide adenosyltransferase [Candidatus Omnitrophica bacterium]|nr:cob(I)yrinic acid a,c-diamide adenosyltransferase [Candidatus Omnitrophota bacterium]